MVQFIEQESSSKTFISKTSAVVYFGMLGIMIIGGIPYLYLISAWESLAWSWFLLDILTIFLIPFILLLIISRGLCVYLFIQIKKDSVILTGITRRDILTNENVKSFRALEEYEDMSAQNQTKIVIVGVNLLNGKYILLNTLDSTNERRQNIINAIIEVIKAPIEIKKKEAYWHNPRYD